MERNPHLRHELLADVAAVAPTLAEHAADSEGLARLNAPSIEALRQTRLLRFICPKDRGGDEADPITQIEIIEALAKIESRSGQASASRRKGSGSGSPTRQPGPTKIAARTDGR